MAAVPHFLEKAFYRGLTTMNTKETPETDAKSFFQDGVGAELVDAVFARSLETRLSKAEKELFKFKGQFETCEVAINYNRNKRDELKQQLLSLQADNKRLREVLSFMLSRFHEIYNHYKRTNINVNFPASLIDFEEAIVKAKQSLNPTPDKKQE